MKELKSIRQHLIQKMEREHTRLCRMWRRAERHGCSVTTLQAIAEERDWMYSNQAYPLRVLDPEIIRKFRYAFR